LESKEGNIMAKNVLIFRDQIVGLLYDALSTGTHGLSNVPGLLRRAIIEEAWKERTVKATGETIPGFKTFREFVETVPPDGLGSTLELIERIVGDDVEVLPLFRALTVGPAGRPSKSIADNVSNKQATDDGHGNSRAYTLDRLKRETPELFKSVVAGELSANAAAIKAGFRQRPGTPFERVVKLWPKLTPDERQQVLELT
jgi:hypothetical protein